MSERRLAEATMASASREGLWIPARARIECTFARTSARGVMMTVSKAKEIADLGEELPIGEGARRSGEPQAIRRRRIDRDVFHAAGVADVERRARMNQVGQEHIARHHLGSRVVDQGLVRKQRVVVDDRSDREGACKLKIKLDPGEVVFEHGAPAGAGSRLPAGAGCQTCVVVIVVEAKSFIRTPRQSKRTA